MKTTIGSLESMARRDAINDVPLAVRQIEIDNYHFASIFAEPIESLLCFDRSIGGMSSFGQVGGEKFRNARIIIDEEEFGGGMVVLHFL